MGGKPTSSLAAADLRRLALSCGPPLSKYGDRILERGDGQLPKQSDLEQALTPPQEQRFVDLALEWLGVTDMVERRYVSDQLRGLVPKDYARLFDLANHAVPQADDPMVAQRLLGNNYMREMAHAKIAERWPGVSVEAGQR